MNLLRRQDLLNFPSCSFVSFADLTGDNISDKENIPIALSERQSSAQSSEPSLDDQLNTLYANQCAKIAVSKTNSEIARFATRLESIAAYFYDSKAPSHVIYRGFLEYFVECVSNQIER